MTYKVNHLVDGKIKSIIVFHGNSEMNKNNYDVFTEKELTNIEENKITVQFSDQQIHLDDNIGVIKIKILNEFKRIVSLEELYLFCEKKESINPVSLYQSLTQNKIELTRIRLDQFLSNIVGESINPPLKDIYNYDDILELKLNKKYIMNKVVGQKNLIIENEYPFVCNPFLVKQYDSLYEKNIRKSTSTMNNLLLNSGDIINNNIYVCFAKDVLTFLSKNEKISQEITIKLYFPFLYLSKIESLDELEESRTKLIDGNDRVITEKVFDNFKTIDMFYDVYKLQTKPLNYVDKGIKFIKAILKPKYDFVIPLEVIFKILHANIQNPFIKYNPSTRQENIYRLYTDKTAIDGRKIPYLKKGIIFKLMKNIGKGKSVTVYVENATIDMLSCEFNENGFVTIISECEKIISIKELEMIFIEYINPIISEIKTYLEQSGYKIDLFTSLTDENVVVEQITYETQLSIIKPFDLDKLTGCISSVFNNESGRLKDDIQLRFKRVSNFNKVTSQEAFILEKREEGLRGDEIIDALLINFKDDLTQQEAVELVKKVANETQLERGVRKTDIKIKNNPGFKTIIKTEKKTSLLTITMENINDIHYLSVIPIYIDTMVRLTQNINTTKYPAKKIKTICSSGEKEDVKVPDITIAEEIPIFNEDTSDVKFSDSFESKQQNALDLFFGDDEEEFKGGQNEKSESSVSSDKSSLEKLVSIDKPSSKKYESEVESEQESEQESEVESASEAEEVKNIDGMSLRNYFQNQIENKDKKLIIKQEVGNYSTYSKICQSSARRQPVIITDAELKKIKTEHKGFLREEDIITYGTDKPYNYICPRYWCLKTNTLVEPKDFEEKMEKGKKVLIHPTCGKIIPKNENKVIPGHYVYEFYTPPANKPDFKRYPNFQIDKHPDGYCLPCCFDKWNTPKTIAAKNKCYNKETKKEEEKEKEEKDEYVKGPDKFPLKPHKWGYLPSSVQTILHEVNADCQISKTNTNLKEDFPCLLRHGVEINETQSFIASISDAIFFAKKTTSEKIVKILTISEMKKRIKQSLTIDDFIKYQNGNLVTDFYNPSTKTDTIKYNDTKLYKKLNMEKEEDRVFYKRVVSAFENFIHFLEDPDVIINHVYLWDIVCTPNKYIFPEGINLVILNIPNNDITNNVEFICPSNHYSTEFYNARRQTLILVKQDNYYEPIYSFTLGKKKNSIQKTFSEYDKQLSKTMRIVFQEIIRPIYKRCLPLASMPKVYLAKQPILLRELVDQLKTYKYKIIKQVINFNNKVIGVIAENPDNVRCFVPCFPSSQIEYEYVFMTENDLWTTYKKTFDFLLNLYKQSNKKESGGKVIPCKPVYKIIEDELVVGILTSSNQFVQISNPLPEIDIKGEYNIPSFKNTNYIIDTKSKPMVQSDIFLTTSNEVDKERVEFIQKIKQETNFYNVFRNTIRILLNDYDNVKTREKMENELSKEYIVYSQKIKVVTQMLKKLAQNKIQFIGDKNYHKLINNISTCIIKNKSQCKDTPNLCTVTENGVCNLILPENNLLTDKMNEPIYYKKMADELIRYNRIKSFIFKPQTYLSFGNIGYNLKDDEIILLQSLITQEYFELLIPALNNKYIIHNSYDETNPQLSQTYENVITESIPPVEKECEKITPRKITSVTLNKCFPKTFKEMGYGKNSYCTFELIIDIMKKRGKSVTTNEIKNDLFEEYQLYLEKYKDKILDILIKEGKKLLGNQVKADILTFSSFIYADNYFLTPFDIWLLMNKYKIPTILISPIYIFQTKYKKHAFTLYGNSEDEFVFIVIPGLHEETVPQFKIIVDGDNIFLSLRKLSDCSEMQESVGEKISIADYLDTFTRETLYAKRKPELVKKTKPIFKIIKDEAEFEKLKETEKLKDDVLDKLIEQTKKRRNVAKGRTQKTQKLKYIPNPEENL